MELCAALLATQVAQIVQDNLRMRITKVQYFTDSRVVLGYLNNRTRRFYNYVSNRVERILHVSKPEQWHYVSTKENPADHGTRGLATGSELQEKWLCGPELLTRLKIRETQVSYPLIQPEHDKEIRVEVRKTTVDENFTVTFDYFSDWGKLINTISRIKMLARRHRGKPQHDMLDETEMRKESEVAIIKIMQKEVYKEDILLLRNGSNVTKDSPLRYLDPYIDESGLLRIGGRLRRGGLRIEQSNPLILPGKTHLTKLLIMSVHKQIHHQGRHITEGALRNRGYWIMGVKRVLNALIGNCVACRKLRGKFESQKMADLPEDRITPGPPFTAVGVDTFGPWNVVVRKTRGNHATQKRWAILFTCLTIRAVHIEIVEEMTSSSFINALRRVVALRGEIKELRSDRGTNFIGAADSIKAEVINVEDKVVKTYLSRSGITWKFNAPHSSHMGGVWERMIGVSRRILDSMLAECKGKEMTHEVLTTFMAEVCTIINSRPITTISYDPDMPMVLTPSLLLTQKVPGHPAMSEGFDIKDIYKAQWRHVQVLADTFWKQWKEHFLNTLQVRRKWTKDHQNLKVGCGSS